jgi:rubrerythrin
MQDPDLAALRSDHHQPSVAREPDRDIEYRILNMLQTHGAREGVALAAYQRVAETSSADASVRYLVRLILDDEVRHHRVFDEMANGLKSFVWEVDIEPRVPDMSPRPDPALLEETHRLLAFEKEDARELRRLRKALKHSPRSSLHPLLVDLMLHDTKKHIAILEHIVSRLGTR